MFLRVHVERNQVAVAFSSGIPFSILYIPQVYRRIYSALIFLQLSLVLTNYDDNLNFFLDFLKNNLRLIKKIIFEYQTSTSSAQITIDSRHRIIFIIHSCKSTVDIYST